MQPKPLLIDSNYMNTSARTVPLDNLLLYYFWPVLFSQFNQTVHMFCVAHAACTPIAECTPSVVINKMAKCAALTS